MNEIDSLQENETLRFRKKIIRKWVCAIDVKDDWQEYDIWEH